MESMYRSGKIVLLLLLSCCWARGAHAQEIPAAPREEEVLPVRPERRGAFPSSIPNPGFEQLLANGHPVGWNVGGQPIVIQEDGNRFARVNSVHRYETDFEPPFKGRHLTLSLLVRAELGFESGGVRFFTFGSPTDLFPTKSFRINSPDWARVYATFPIVIGNDFNRVVPVGSDATNWIDFDDLIVFGEGLDNGDFEIAETAGNPLNWALAGGASIIADSTLQAGGSNALALAVGASAEKLSGSLNDGQQYFVAGRARALGGASSLGISETWRSVSGTALGNSSTTIAIGTQPQLFVWESGNAQSAEASTAGFVNSGANTLVLDTLSRGYTDVWPDIYYADPQHPRIFFNAAWPEQLSSANVVLRDPEGGIIESFGLPLVGPGAAWAEKDFSFLAPGVYEALFQLEDQSGAAIELARTLEVRATSPLPEPQPRPFESIARIAWVWLYDIENSATAIQPYLEQAVADGFNLAVISDSSTHFPATMVAAENAGLPLILATEMIGGRIRAWPTFNEFNRAEFEELMKVEIEPVMSSPMYHGFYMVDEPGFDFRVQYVHHALSVTELHPEWKTAYFVVAPSPNYLQDLNGMKSPAFGLDHYNSTPSTVMNCEANFRDVALRVGETVAAARALGRDMWFVFQGFTDPYNWRLPNDTMISTLGGIALAEGARGYGPFVHKSINQLDGIRGRSFEETSTTQAMRGLNQRVAASNDVLMSLSGHDEFPAAGPVLVTTARNAGDVQHFFVVPLNCFDPVRVTLSFSQPSGTLTNVMDSSSLPFSGGSLQLQLEPGAWQLYRTSSGELTGVASVAIPSALNTIELPVVLDKVLATGSTHNIHDIAFHPAADQIAVAANQRGYLIDRAGTVIASQAYSNAMRVDYANADHALFADRTLGLFAVRTVFPYLQIPSFVRRTGSSSGILGEGNDVWMTLQYWGIRRLDLQPSGAANSLGVDFAGSLTETIVGPFSDGSVLYLDMDRAIRNSRYELPSGVTSTAQYINDRLYGSSLAPSKGRLAVARMRRGLSVHEIAPDGTVVNSTTPDTGMQDIESVAWLDDSALFAASVTGLVRLFYVADDLSIVRVIDWQHPQRDSALMCMRNFGPEIALGYHNGRIVLLDASDYYQRINVGSALWMIQ